ncbi:MAG: restriction endonuclease subunit S [Deltaproteobacteria bacterium]|nr:restriction endonuclease subunit S [Deltaproteobacteria bacterium]
MIPKGWHKERLLDWVEMPKGQVDPKIDPYSSMPLVAPNHIPEGGGPILHLEIAMKQNAISGKFLVKKGQVIYSKIRPYLKKATIAPVDCLCSADMYPLFAKKIRLLNSYLYYVLISDDFTKFAIEQSGRTGIPKINREELGEYYLYLPPLPEQKKIAEILATWDRGIGIIKTLINKIESQFKTLLKILLSQKSHKDKLGNFFKIKNGYAFKSNEFVKNGIPVIRISNISNGLVSNNGVYVEDKYFERFNDFLVSKGDVLIAMSGATTGKFGIYYSDKRALLNQRVGKFEVVDSSKVDSRIIFYLLVFLQPKIFEIAAGGAQPNISSKKIESLEVSLPNFNQQIAICNYLDRLNKIMKINKETLKKFESQKQGLMQNLLTGKIRVNI